MLVGFLYYFSVEDKSSIKDVRSVGERARLTGLGQNFLLNVQLVDPGNGGLFVAQFLLLFQMVSVCVRRSTRRPRGCSPPAARFPLLVYVIRFQFMDFFYNDPYPSFKHVFALNACVAYTSILMAVYFQNISAVLRCAPRTRPWSARR